MTPQAVLTAISIGVNVLVIVGGLALWFGGLKNSQANNTTNISKLETALEALKKDLGDSITRRLDKFDLDMKERFSKFEIDLQRRLDRVEKTVDKVEASLERDLSEVKNEQLSLRRRIHYLADCVTIIFSKLGLQAPSPSGKENDV